MAEPARWALLLLLGVVLLAPVTLAVRVEDGPKPPTHPNNGDNGKHENRVTAPTRILAAATAAFISSTTGSHVAAAITAAIASSTCALVTATTSVITSTTGALFATAASGAIASSTGALLAATTSGGIPSTTGSTITSSTRSQRRGLLHEQDEVPHLHLAGVLSQQVPQILPHGLRHLQDHCNLPGAVCQDPRFIGGDGNTFYFHGRRDRDFCLLSDANLHINGHFVGNHVPGLKRDPTWVQAIAVQFSGGHRLYVGARRTAVWDDDSDRLAVVFDGETVQLQRVAHARWESGSGLSVTRTKAANGVLVELDGVFKITANVVPITKEDSRIHRYGVTDDDCLAHLDLAFKFYALTDDVHGVLGQTYRSSYVNRLDVSAKMPVMGGEKQFTSSGLFAADCAVARFGRAGDAGAVAVASEELVDVKCSTGLDGVGVVCKK
ncbi:hypothetical protein OsJ_19472 [Oryza sativa Japonica Group]|uniref:Uncharacterized protein n=1 Tax=Oryza sativa subsp. japonica TaxID=39947 RepID=B9FHV4_ORYSJ|nr:hypothetical protein OsJ_19472 [Oryza sativa Japonica Group]